MVSEMVGGPRVVVVRGVVDVLAVSLCVGVLRSVELGVVREEQTIPCLILLGLLVLFVAVGLIVRLEHCALSHIQAFFGNHSGERFDVRAGIPFISHLIGTKRVESKAEASKGANLEELSAEYFSGVIAGVHVHEVVDKALLGYDRHTTLILLCTSAHPHTEG